MSDSRVTYRVTADLKDESVLSTSLGLALNKPTSVEVSLFEVTITEDEATTTVARTLVQRWSLAVGADE